LSPTGVVAAGHPATAEAAAVILEAGGNAFDAVIAGQLAACVAEPVLCSLGGGGFLLTRQGQGPVRALDFFVQTPVHKRPAQDIEFLPILADFGDAQQEFHIGLGSVATPGMVAGLFEAHRRLASLPMSVLVEPAVRFAREGVRVNALQAYAFRIVGAIYSHSAPARALYGSPTRPGTLVVEGDVLRQPALADTLERLAQEGEDWFYRGEFAHRVADLCAREGGQLRLEDLQRYRAHWREPLALDYRGHRIWINPPPSSGGLLLGFALKLLEALEPVAGGAGSAAHLERLARVMALTDRARVETQSGIDGSVDAARLLDPEFLARYRNEVQGRTYAPRGAPPI
jgi:gamma-glutamyltranspeptidase / glutathione hydrolase